jgi:hypothetical protein
MTATSLLALDGDVEWLIDGSWTKLTLLVLVAVCVLVVSQTVLKRSSGARRPSRTRRLDFDLDVARMSKCERSDIAALSDGPSKVEGVIRSATENLGGDKHPIVYFNRAGEGRDAAVAAELVLVGDETGQAALMHLDQARVIAAPESGPRYERVCLRVGDRVEVLGTARKETAATSPEGSHSSSRVYATLGANAPIQVRVIDSAIETTSPDTTPSPTRGESTPIAASPQTPQAIDS